MSEADPQEDNRSVGEKIADDILKKTGERRQAAMTLAEVAEEKAKAISQANNLANMIAERDGLNPNNPEDQRKISEKAHQLILEGTDATSDDQLDNLYAVTAKLAVGLSKKS